MGVPKRTVSVPEQETHFDCLPLRDHKPPQQTKWLRVQDQRRMRKKPNKRVSQNQSYQRHHLIRISSCHKTTSKKKTKKRILLKQKFIPSKTNNLKDYEN